jgi:antitoxin (DNA-binding transcriptional repressor) of toxin-antitoxin stability system
MSATQLSVSEFKARCTSILRQLEAQPERIEVTNRGRVIAVVLPPTAETPVNPADWLGSLRGSVLHYEAPTAPAVDPATWDALRS